MTGDGPVEYGVGEGVGEWLRGERGEEDEGGRSVESRIGVE